MKTKIFFFSLFVMIFFSACVPQNISPMKLKTISKIGVISYHGNKMDITERGLKDDFIRALTLFESENNKADILSWKIDEFVSKEIANILKNKYEIQNIYFSGNEKKLYTATYEDKLKVLKSVIIKNKLDVLIVFEKGAIIREHHDSVSGIGIVKVKTLGMEGTMINLNIDLKSYELRKNKIELLHFNDIKAFKEIENNLWVDTTKTLPQESINKIEKDVKNLLSNSLIKEMKKIGYLK